MNLLILQNSPNRFTTSIIGMNPQHRLSVTDRLIQVGLILFLPQFLVAQVPDSAAATGLLRPTVEEVLKTQILQQTTENISITGFNTNSVRETAGIVSVITREEISNSGARDLTDVLRLIPGLNFGHLYDGGLGLTIRGNSAVEGKFLMMIDGQPLNESSFGIFVFGQRVVPANIERIEIIRGPGSVEYGGLALLGVINVITSKASDREELNFSGNLGMAQGSISRYFFTLGATQKYHHDISIDVAGFVSVGNRSNQKIDSLIGKSINFRDSSEVRSVGFNMGVQAKDFNLRLIYLDLKSRSPLDLFDAHNHDIAISSSYKCRITSQFSLTPAINWRRQLPFVYENYQYLIGEDRQVFDAYYTINNRFTSDLIGLWEVTPQIHLSTGVEFYYDHVRYRYEYLRFYTGKSRATLNNMAAFGELSFQSKLATFTLGARYDKNSAATGAFVPRFAITKAWEKLHLKLLASRAFKTPTLLNIHLAPDNRLNPEFANCFELEAGYQFDKVWSIEANVFDIRIIKPIIYVFDYEDNTEFYYNQAQTGSRGAEAEVRWRNKQDYLHFNYSFYNPVYNQVENYKIPDNKTMLLGIPAHSFKLNAHYNLTKRFSLNVTAMYFTEKYAYQYFDTDFTDYRLTRLPAELMLNCQLNYKGFLLKGLNFAVSGFDLLGDTHYFVDPTSSANGILPLPKREFIVKLSYHVGRAH
jgi:outer membrane receptor protein involved in Fe transport